MESNDSIFARKTIQLGIDSSSKPLEEKNTSSNFDERTIKGQAVELLGSHQENQPYLGTHIAYKPLEARSTSGNQVTEPKSSNEGVSSFAGSGALPPYRPSYPVSSREWDLFEPNWKRIDEISDHVVDRVISRLLLLLVLLVLALGSVTFACSKLREIPYSQYEKYLPEFLREG